MAEERVQQLTGDSPSAPKTRTDLALEVLFWLSFVAMMIVYFAQFTTPLWRSWDPPGFGYTAAHVAAAGVMVSVWYIGRKKNSIPTWVIGLVMMAIFAIMGFYMAKNALALLFRPSYGTAADLTVGIAMLVAVFYLSWLYWGAVFPILGLLFVAYLFFADVLPGPLKGPALDTHNILTRQVHKSFGDITQLSASFLWMLVFWGLFMGQVGGGTALLGVARKLSQGIAGGPALGSLFSSAIAGSFVGGGASNVAITGPVTIPAMRRAGYTPEEAASVEAMASNASSITPPILGAVAFIMSDILGVSYVEIIVMSLVPAFLWFLAVGSWIVSHGQRNKHRIRPMQAQVTSTGEDLSLWTYARSAIILITPVTAIVLLVLQGYTLKMAALVAFLITLVLATVLRVETRLSVWASAIKSAATYASSISVIIVVVMLISDALVFTGMGGRLGRVIETISGGQVVIAAALMVLMGVILGGPLPALPVYFIMIVTFAPALERMGVPTIATHYVAFWMGALGSITLPVAASCLVAAAIAQTKYWPTAKTTAKVSWPLWVYPLLFALAPTLLLQGDRDAYHTIVVIATSAIVMVGVQCATGGWLLGNLSMPLRLVLYANFGLLVLAFAPTDQSQEILPLMYICVAVVVAVALVNWRLSRGAPAPAAAGAAGAPATDPPAGPPS